MNDIRIRVFYPADPVGVVPGGIDTFLRGLVKWAPQDLSFSLVGMSTDTQQRPLGRWTTCRSGSREFDIYPVCAVKNAGARGRVPLSVRFMAGLNRDRLAVASGFDIFDFHRVEPALMWSQDRRPKNIFFHQDPTFVRLSASDNLWRRMPGIYERVERSAMQGMSSAWCVRESGVAVLRDRYPALAEHIRFVPTWVDPEAFGAVDEARRQSLRRELGAAYAIPHDASWVVSVGRLDTQKDPLLMFDAFARLRAQGRHLRWLVVGDGVLRSELQRRIAAAGIGDTVHFLGLQPPAKIADILRAADAFALSSAYEGMPMALLEALGSGLPAVATDVGEVSRVVLDGRNGRITPPGKAEAYASALADVLDHGQLWRGAAATTAVQAYLPQQVLAPVYANYRRLGETVSRLRQGVHAIQAADTATRVRRPVVGVAVDAIDRAAVDQRLMTWAEERQSRVVCFVNVHSAILSTGDERHRMALAGADLAAPDGAPIAWTLRVKGRGGQPRVDGPGTMWRLCDLARARGVRVGLYGSTTQTLDMLSRRLRESLPGIDIGFVHSPPFRELSPQEDQAICDQVAQSGVGLLFVSLGCPKQEYWMATHRGRIPSVMLGVGAAFDFHAGVVARAPQWMGDAGLEWLHRLASQPGRLGRRYAYTNSLFMAKSLGEAMRSVVGRVRLTGPVRGRTRS